MIAVAITKVSDVAMPVNKLQMLDAGGKFEWNLVRVSRMNSSNCRLNSKGGLARAIYVLYCQSYRP